MTADKKPAGPVPVTPTALAGVRVLEFSQIIAGPFAGLTLSDFGADVVKVEPLGGEARRNSAAVVPNEGKYFQSLNRGKRSLTIDLSLPQGQEIVQKMIPSFDVVIVNYRLGVPERLGIDYSTLSRLNPRLIYAVITGFGTQGPMASEGGSDIVAQAYSGLMAAEGKVDELGAPSQIVGTPLIDRTCALAAALGICAALVHRERTGEGQQLHVSLLHTALELMSHQVMREPVHDAVLREPLLRRIQDVREAGGTYQQQVAVRKAQGSLIASQRLYYGGYNALDGSFVLGALTRQNREAARRILGIQDATDNPDFDANDPLNRQRVESWRRDIQRILAQRPVAEWVGRFLAAGVPASIVQVPEEMADDPQVIANGMMTELVHDVTGTQLVVSPLVAMSKTPTAARIPAPVLGAHSREVLIELGWSEGEVDELVAAHVVSQCE